MLTSVRPCALREAFVYQFVCSFKVGQLCYKVFLYFGKANIGDLLAVRSHCARRIIYHSTTWIGDWRSGLRKIHSFSVPWPCKAGLFLLRLSWQATIIGFPEFYLNNLSLVFMGGKDSPHWWNKRYVCVYPGCRMLLPKIVAREELQGSLIISSGSQEKKGGSAY